MQTANELTRHFSMTYAELYETATRISESMVRDLSDLSQFGITQAKITALNSLISQYLEILNDEMYKSDYMNAVQLRQDKRNQLNIMLKRVAIAAEAVFRNDYAIIHSLVFDNMAKATDSEFAVNATKIHKNAVSHQVALAAESITPEYLESLETVITEYSTAVSNARVKLDVRETKTEERIKMANTLYANLVTYSKYGKLLYENVSPAKYNDYILTPTSTGGLKPPTGLKYLIDQNTVVWDAVANATSYELQYSPDGADWSEAYGGADNMVYYFPPQEGWAYFRCRARNANGYGEYSAVLKTGYYQVLPPPSNIHAKIAENTDNGLILTWDEVPSAANYKIYTSIVPIESPAGAFTMLEKTASTKYTCELERDKRHYFQLISENSSQTSLYSTAVFIDVYGAMPS